MRGIQAGMCHTSEELRLNNRPKKKIPYPKLNHYQDNCEISFKKWEVSTFIDYQKNTKTRGIYSSVLVKCALNIQLKSGWHKHIDYVKRSHYFHKYDP